MADHSTLELHEDDNFIFALDVSGSMATRDCPGNLTRFEYSLEKMKQFCHEAAKFENEGICIFRFGAVVTKFDHISEDKIDSIIGSSSPDEMATRTDLVIQAAYEEHLEDGHEDTFLFLITDGAPTNMQLVIDVVIAIANKVKSPKEFKIVFLTVGTIVPELQSFLDKLDHGLNVPHDIVDVLSLDKVSFMAAVKQAVSV